MRIALASDLHLEFSDIELKNTENAEVLLLAGDIMLAEDLKKHPDINVLRGSKDLGYSQLRSLRFQSFLERVSSEFPHVVYIAGNHEFYNGSFPAHITVLREQCSRFPNIYFLENDCKKIGDYTFIGCTLWTDMNRGDPLTMHAVTDMMNDYKVIHNSDAGYTKLRPAHTMSRHRQSLDYIRVVVEGKFDEKFVLVGHMAPSTLSIHEDYKHETLTNGAYVSDLSEFILDRPQIKLWCHGHVHNPFDYMIGETRVLCNPRGYQGYEVSASQFSLKFVDI